MDLDALFAELGRRRFTNVLVEGGSRLFGSLFDKNLVDEMHVFVGAKIVGGTHAITAVGGHGFGRIGDAQRLEAVKVDQVGSDVYIHGRL